MTVLSPRVVFAGLGGDGGKTLAAIGVIRALRRKGLAVASFKKGPDFIDAAWLGAASGSPGRNLDTFLMRSEAIGLSLQRAAGADVIVIEGNRGLHDGVDAIGTHSTAELARRLGAPVVMVVDATKSTRTLAACVFGCASIEPGLDVAGVVLNRVATSRQERVVRDAFKALGGPLVLGAMPRVSPSPLPSRHLGLMTPSEHAARESTIELAADLASAHIDLDALMRVAGRAQPAAFPEPAAVRPPVRTVRIAVLRDEAFSFYYPENLEALAGAGAEIVDVSPLHDRGLPQVDALYVGGGFPEVHAPGLWENAAMREAVRAMAARGLPIYAECGGLMYLARELRVRGTAYPMCGVLDIAVEQTDTPQGHGYVEARIDAANPFFPVGTRLRGHEFHYSRVVEGSCQSVLHVERGTGLGDGRDAIVLGRVWASYLHLHALGSPTWASALVDAAIFARRGPAAMSA